MRVVCASCGIGAEPSNGTCTVCNAPFVATTLPDRPWSSLAVAAVITVLAYAVLRMLGVHSALLGVPLFYGPLIAAYLARRNAVWPAALGGALGGLIVIGVNLGWTQCLSLLGQLLGVKEVKTVLAIMYGLPLVLFVGLLPVCLVGASVGDLLAQRTRRFTRSLA